MFDELQRITVWLLSWPGLDCSFPPDLVVAPARFGLVGCRDNESNNDSLTGIYQKNKITGPDSL